VIVSRPADAFAANSDWRRACLERQLPRVRFPFGVSAANLCGLLVLLVLAGCAVALFSRGPAGGVDSGDVTSQHDLAEDVAKSIGYSAANRARSLAALAEPYQKDSGRNPVALLAALAKDHARWTGVAIVSVADRTVNAYRGEAIPLDVVPRQSRNETAQYSAITPAGPRIVTVVPLPRGEALVAASPVWIRTLRLDPERSQSLALTVAGGRIVKRQGPAPVAADRALLRHAAGLAARRQIGETYGPRGRRAGETAVSVTLMSYRPVVTGHDIGDGLRLGVVAGIRTRVVPPPDPRVAFLVGGSLAAVSAFAVLVIHLGVVRPVRRVRRRAFATACGEKMPRARRSMIKEFRRVDALLDHLGHHIAGAARPRHSGIAGGLSVVWIPAVASALLVAWAATVLVVLGTGPVRVPRHVLVDAEDRVSRGVNALNRNLQAGLSDLRALAQVGGRLHPTAVRDRIHAVYRHSNRYRSIYLADSDGDVLAREGREPLGDGRQPPDVDGVYQGNTSGRLPLVYAVVHVAHRHRVLVAEFDLRFLSRLLEHRHVRTVIVDSELRTILDTHGYVAFDTVEGTALAGPVRAAQAGRGSASVRMASGTRSVIAAQRLPTDGVTAGLPWVLLDQRAVSDLDLPDNVRHRWASLMSLVVVCVATVLVGFYVAGVARPLRALAEAADELMAGDSRSVIYPVRHDEVGATAICLDICRQAMVRGDIALGGVFRVRQDDAVTAVFPAIRDAPASDRTQVITLPRPARQHDDEPTMVLTWPGDETTTWLAGIGQLAPDETRPAR
jgi:HAMP domain-containing protein